LRHFLGALLCRPIVEARPAALPQSSSSSIMARLRDPEPGVLGAVRAISLDPHF
jgi:hypothetical protein